MSQSSINSASDAEEIKCSNCGHIDTGTFCSICGNSLSKNRLTISILLSSIIDFFYNIEDKYVHTFKALLLRPIPFIIEYLDGKRDRYYIPFKYFFLNLGISIFVSGFFNVGQVNDVDAEDELDAIIYSRSSEMYDHIINNYGSFFSLLIIPFFVFTSNTLFPKTHHNTAEKATAITYMFGQLMIYRVFLNLITAAFPGFYDINCVIILILEFGIIFLLSYQFFKETFIHSAWKSMVIFARVFLSLRYVLILLQDILQMIYD
ncbi:MAG: DUF3667 domain-containing protein [Saprospiraceae bacterium]|nr:DUF3667 domain-containing protein [Saprospiraceae bacterium]